MTCSSKSKSNFFYFLFFTASLLISNVYSQTPNQIQLKANLPLGLTYDGTVAWLVDAKKRILQGYNLDRNKKLSIKKLKIPGVRDIAFWKDDLISPYKKNIFIINPINGEIVKKLNTPFLKNPISIAINKDMAFIYDKKEKKIFRYNLAKQYLFGYFPWSGESLRGATYYRGYLWVVRKDGFALKLDSSSGEMISSIPLPNNSYGIHFINGALFVSTPNNIQNVDYIETPYFTAASIKKYSITSTLQLQIAHLLKQTSSDATKKNYQKLSFKLRIRALPSNAHQRGKITSLSNRNFKKKRKENGEIEIYHKFLPNHYKSTSQMKAMFSLYTINYFFTQKTRKEHFEEKSVEKNILHYIDFSKIKKSLLDKVDAFANDQKNKTKNLHPSDLLKLLYEQNKKSLDFQVAFFRKKGIPARLEIIYDMLKEDFYEYLQIYIRPTGWLTITSDYTPTNPYQFPIKNTELQLFYFDSIILKPLIKKSQHHDYKKLIQWKNIRVTEIP